MGALLGSLLVAVVGTAVVGGVGAALTALPFVVAVDRAERRGASPARWGAVQLLALLLAGVLLLAALRGSALLLLAVPVVCWLPPLLVDRLPGGVAGRHEH